MFDSAEASRSNDHGSGTRSVCDLGLQQTAALPSNEPLADLLEVGDLLLCRSTGNWLSDLIAGLDGYWTHSALYCGNSTIVHAYTAGVGQVGLDKFVGTYPDGLAVARPSRSLAEREAAAKCALDLAEADPGDVAYSGWDLGVAFAVLRRAQARGAWRSLPGDDGLESMEHMLWNRDGITEFSSTCSGLVYRCYSEGAKAPLKITPAPGLDVEDEQLVFPTDDEALYKAAVAETAAGEEWAPELEGFGRPDLSRWKDKFLLIGGALAGWAFYAAADDRSVPLKQGVSPSDLWCSDDISQRWFVSDEHAKKATEATSGCGQK